MREHIVKHLRGNLKKGKASYDNLMNKLPYLRTIYQNDGGLFVFYLTLNSTLVTLFMQNK